MTEDIKPDIKPDIPTEASSSHYVEMAVWEDEYNGKPPTPTLIGSRKASEPVDASPSSKRAKTLIQELNQASYQALLQPKSLTQEIDEVSLAFFAESDAFDASQLSDPVGNVDRALPAPVPIVEAEPELSTEQRGVFDRVMEGQSVFFTGPAGTGKSVLLRTIIKGLQKRLLLPDEVAVTASTGMAAMNIGGCTVHSWSGIGLGNLQTAVHIAKINNWEKPRLQWRKAKTLVIDEVSMIHADLIDKLNSIGKAIREDPRPFGGLQVIFCGDFFQLPPVTKGVGTGYSTDRFAFDAVCWEELFTPANIVTLSQVFRQRDDKFVGALERLRRGVVTDEDLTLYRSCGRSLDASDGIKPVLLFSRRYQVEKENNENLDRLPDTPRIYVAQDSAGPLGRNLSAHQIAQKLDDSTRFPRQLELKIGAQVMLVSNSAVRGFVNGSTGKVVGFADPPVLEPVADYANRTGVEKVAAIKQRKEDEKDAALGPLPIVELLPNRRCPFPVTCTIQPMNVDVQGPGGDPIATRWQIPLILAWAMTIHKAQGLTLERVRVNVDGAFELGQVYVAVSRVTSLEGLEIVGFDKRKVMASERVIEWTDELADQDVR